MFDGRIPPEPGSTSPAVLTVAETWLTGERSLPLPAERGPETAQARLEHREAKVRLWLGSIQ